MPRERELDATLSPLAFFGAEVRRARTAAGMSLADLGQLVPCDKSTVSRVESGLLAPDEAFARACDQAFPAAGGWFARFYEAHAKWDIAMPPRSARSSPTRLEPRRCTCSSTASFRACWLPRTTAALCYPG